MLIIPNNCTARFNTLKRSKVKQKRGWKGIYWRKQKYNRRPSLFIFGWLPYFQLLKTQYSTLKPVWRWTGISTKIFVGSLFMNGKYGPISCHFGKCGWSFCVLMDEFLEVFADNHSVFLWGFMEEHGGWGTSLQKVGKKDY